MKKFFLFAILVSIMGIAVSCDKNGSNKTDGYKGYYLQYRGEVYRNDYPFYYAFYLDGQGGGMYYENLTSRSGYWGYDPGEEELHIGSKYYYYQTNCGVKITYTISDNTVYVMEGSYFLKSFNIGDYTYYPVE